MKGTFEVKDVVDQGAAGLALRGTVTAGQLASGMEARSGSIIIIISQIFDKSGEMHLKSAKKGQRILIHPLQTVYDLLKLLEGEVLEFEDIRSVPIKEKLSLRPDPI